MSLAILLPHPQEAPDPTLDDDAAARTNATALEGLTRVLFKALVEQGEENAIFRMHTARWLTYHSCDLPPTFTLSEFFERTREAHSLLPQLELIDKETTNVMFYEEAEVAEVLMIVDVCELWQDIKTQIMSVLSWTKQGWIWKAYKFRSIRKPIPGI